MNKNEKLIESITGFFITMGKRDGHRSDHILYLLREIHFTAPVPCHLRKRQSGLFFRRHQ